MIGEPRVSFPNRRPHDEVGSLDLTFAASPPPALGELPDK